MQFYESPIYLLIQKLTVYTLANKGRGSRIFGFENRLLLLFDMLWKTSSCVILLPNTEMPVTENPLVGVMFCMINQELRLRT